MNCNTPSDLTIERGGDWVVRILTMQVLATVAMLTLASQAVAVTWYDAAGGTFQDGANWGGGVMPGPADFSLFDLGSQTYTVNFAANVNNRQLIVGRDNVTFDFAGFAYDLTQTTPESIFVGQIASDSAVLTLTNGTLSGVDATVGQTAGSTGDLNVPTGGTLALSGDLWMGELGSGSMNVTGGTVNTNTTWVAKDAGSFGDVLLTGPTALWTNSNSVVMGAGTSTLTVENGATLNTNRLTIASTFSGTADVVLDGSTSQINIANELTMSSLGGTSTMTVRNGADLTSGNGIIANVGIGGDAQFLITGAGSTWISTGEIFAGLGGDAPGGVLRIENGAVVTSATGAIGSTSDGQGAALVDGIGASWNMTGDLQVGLGTATLSVTNGGVVQNANGVIDSANPARPIAILVDGPGSTWANSGAVTGGSGATLTIQNGGTVTSDSADFRGQLTLDGAGSQWQIANGLTIGYSPVPIATISNGATLTSNGGTLNRADVLVSGGTWTNTGTLTLNDTFQSNLRITNGGVVTSQATVLVETAGRVANVTVEGASSLWQISGDLRIADAGDDGFGGGGAATLTIRDGGQVDSDNVVVATAANSQATIFLENSDTLWDISGNLVLGGPDFATSGGTTNMTIASDATVQVGATMKVHVGSNVQLLGGTLSVFGSDNFIVDDADDFDFLFGTLQYRNNATFSFSDMQMVLGLVPTLGPAKTIEVGGTATLNTSLIIDGGTFSVGQLQGSSTPLFLSGTLSLTNDNLTVGVSGRFGTNLALQSNRVLNIGNTVTIDPGSLLTIDQTTMTAGYMANNGEVILSGASAFLGGGNMDNMGRLSGSGRLGLGLSNAPGGVVQVSSGDHLIAAGGQNFNSGRIDLTGGTLEFTQFTQNNSDGQIVGQGTIISRSTFINDGDMVFSGTTNFVGNITNSGSGLIRNTGAGPTTFFDDVIQNGDLRTSIGASTVFLGAVSGTGSYSGTGTIRFEGDFTPGASPADIAFAGDIVLTESARLEIELAGNGGVPGTDFDRLNIAGTMDLGGALQISLLGGYMPSLGDSFQVLIAGNRNGMFDSILGTDLGGGLLLDVLYGFNNVTLQVVSAGLAGDFDFDADVDGADFLKWQRAESPIPMSTSDLADWEANFGVVGPPSSASAAVPEPTSGILLILGLALLSHRQPSSGRS